jgi:hypothetical protein
MKKNLGILAAGVAIGGAAIYYFLKQSPPSKPTPPATKPMVPQPPSPYDMQDTINHWIDANPSYRSNINIINSAYDNGEISLDDAIMRTRQLIKIYRDDYSSYILRKHQV